MHSCGSGLLCEGGHNLKRADSAVGIIPVFSLPHLQPRVKRWAGLHDFNYRSPAQFSAAPGGVSGQPGNNGSYAPAKG